jgi:hypothetical protein
MSDGAGDLARVIGEEHAQWDVPIVDLAIFGTADPAVIAGRIDALCAEHLGASIRSARFYRVSVGCVAGLHLADGRGVVVKVQRGGRAPAYLAACFDVRRALVATGFPCPQPLAGPTSVGDAWATIEELDLRGEPADAHDPAVRRELAATLARLAKDARAFVGHPAFCGAWFTTIPEGQTFPTPHSPLFDFDATAEGAAWIDALAARARALRHDARGERVVGHFDWRIEHVRFEAGRIVTSFDWDSLHVELEPVVVGAGAHAFTADWQREDLVRVPSIDEIRAFVADYEAARGGPFDRDERMALGASLVFSLAYTARCNHARSPTDEGFNGDFRPLLRREGEAILAGGI